MGIGLHHNTDSLSMVSMVLSYNLGGGTWTILYFLGGSCHGNGFIGWGGGGGGSFLCTSLGLILVPGNFTDAMTL